MDYDLSKFKNGLESLNIFLTQEQYQQFIVYYEMLIEKNKIMNLTAITEYEEVVEKHFLDSLSLCKKIDLQKDIFVLDLGTGAGFPGIPLKIAFPELNIVLIDSLNKRILFLKDVIDKLCLKRIEAIHGRAEEMARNKAYRERFDLCTSRAVANLSSLSEYCLPFVKVDGVFAAYKSGDIEEEVKQSKKAIDVLGGKINEVFQFKLPNTEVSRSFVLIQKCKQTPGTYPRKSGTPSKNPIS